MVDYYHESFMRICINHILCRILKRQTILAYLPEFPKSKQ